MVVIISHHGKLHILDGLNASTVLNFPPDANEKLGLAGKSSNVQDQLKEALPISGISTVHDFEGSETLIR